MLAGTFHQQRIFLNSLRFLPNDLCIPVAGLDTDEAKQALMSDQ
jgi:Bacterial TniB protein